jgi:hypothetical protein
LDYGHVVINGDKTPQICLFNVNAIHSPCIAVPFKTSDCIMTAIKWLFLKPRCDWNTLFIEHLREFVGKKQN